VRAGAPGSVDDTAESYARAFSSQDACDEIFALEEAHRASVFSGSAVTFVRHADPEPKGAALAIWARGEARVGRPIVGLEDRVLSSMGLGAR